MVIYSTSYGATDCLFAVLAEAPYGIKLTVSLPLARVVPSSDALMEEEERRD